MRAEEKQYGKVAVKAVEICERNGGFEPFGAWVESARAVSDKKSVQEKVCPKNAFLGLCEEGLVKGVPAGCYVQSKNGGANKVYSLEAVRLLQGDESLAHQLVLLWDKVMARVGVEGKKHNGQMDVVAALWNIGRIQKL